MNVAWIYNESGNTGADLTNLKVSDFRTVGVSITKS